MRYGLINRLWILKFLNSVWAVGPAVVHTQQKYNRSASCNILYSILFREELLLTAARENTLSLVFNETKQFMFRVSYLKERRSCTEEKTCSLP